MNPGTSTLSENADQPVTTLSGVITKSPSRIKNIAGRPMVKATILAESKKRSAYPLTVVGFDIMALELMAHLRGERLTVTGRMEWNGGYSLIADQIFSMS
ncbi:hypothetical protein SGGMMB4_01824 [Sodalis glossinidius str. 'morsitans']|uniref:Uncharacterized protein n=1 Tax=Sodalis glossinidius (strain morsitans) TaxID=343509 RepID=A0A193QHI2_SODGM|nr:hypothetical protein [Sodalis glossinidius]CRL44626.1 hypothetical protein SGGMMB4_01824 [Sodalis glossinidius str. 'morsitans']